MIRFLSFILLTAMLFICGCADDPHSSKNKLAESFVTALAGEDQETFWQAFAPEMQEKIIKNSGGDEDRARETLFNVFLTAVKEKYQIKEPEDIVEKKENFRKITDDLLQDEKGKFIKINDKWYINADF